VTSTPAAASARTTTSPFSSAPDPASGLGIVWCGHNISHTEMSKLKSIAARQATGAKPKMSPIYRDLINKLAEDPTYNPASDPLPISNHPAPTGRGRARARATAAPAANDPPLAEKATGHKPRPKMRPVPEPEPESAAGDVGGSSDVPVNAKEIGDGEPTGVEANEMPSPATGKQGGVTRGTKTAKAAASKGNAQAVAPSKSTTGTKKAGKAKTAVG
jgi:hypothetical protein